MAQVQLLKINSSLQQERHSESSDSIKLAALGVGASAPTVGSTTVGSLTLGGSTYTTLAGVYANRSDSMGAAYKWVTAQRNQIAGNSSDVAGSVRAAYATTNNTTVGSARLVSFFAKGGSYTTDFTLLSSDQDLVLGCESTGTSAFDTYVYGCDMDGNDEDGGSVQIEAGDAGPCNTAGCTAGDLILKAGSGQTGTASLGAGVASAPGDVVIYAGDAAASVSVSSGQVSEKGGDVFIYAGDGKNVAASNGSGAEGGDIHLRTGLDDPVTDGGDGEIICRVGTTTAVPNVRPYTASTGYLGTATYPWDYLYADNVVSNDQAFTDTHCPKCHQLLQAGDTLVMYAHKTEIVEGRPILYTVPAHRRCPLEVGLKVRLLWARTVRWLKRIYERASKPTTPLLPQG